MKKNRLTLTSRDILVTLLFILALALGTLAHAQENTDNKTLSPYFLVLSAHSQLDPLPLKATSAEVNIAGVISDVTIHQIYKNEGKTALEAVYTFPASVRAAVYALEMKTGSRIIKARIEERKKARNDYEQAKSEGKRASLLEQERPNVFQMNVANIMPGDQIEVTLKYTELMIPEAGVYSFVLPTVVGPRYTGESKGNNFSATPYSHAGTSPLYDFGMHVKLNAGMPIQSITSNSHRISVQYPSVDQAEVDLDPSETAGGNRDFILNYQLAGEKIGSGLLLYEHGDEQFFLLMMQPAKKVVKEEVPPREYIFIVDVSGSMNGFPLNVSKSLMRNLIVNLRPTDKFNVVVFAGNTGSLAPLSIPATVENVEKACRFIDSQNGGGGTELLSALQTSLALPKNDPAVSRSFVIITDGYVDVEKEAFDLIRKSNDQANLFAFGIGSSVNRFLIEGMARAGQGEPFVVTNEKEAVTEASKFRSYIHNPLLTNIHTSFSGFDAYEVDPITIPDLFAERPLIIFGKYHGTAKGTITIKGQSGTKAYVKTFKVQDVKPVAENAAIRYLWARNRITTLDDYNNIRADEKSIEEVTSLGLKYNLLTAYTSFIAIEEDTIANKGSLEKVKQALPMPQNVEDAAVGFDLETDGDLSTFEAYSEIVFQLVKDEKMENRLLKEIEDHLIQQLTSSIINSGETISNIHVTIDPTGRVDSVTISGAALPEQIKEELLSYIRKWSFSRFNLKLSWSFDIKF